MAKKGTEWTQEEIEILKNMYPKLGKCQELQALFPNRNLNSITLKASRLGIKVLNPKTKGRTNQEYIALLEKTNFICLEEYKGSTIPILHMCVICDHEWKTRPQAVLRTNARCPACDLRFRKVDINTVDSVLANVGIVRISEYTGALSPLVVKHLVCDTTWTTKYAHIQQGSGCGICNKGFGYLPTNSVEKAKVYLLDIITSTEHFIKVGVTVQPINRRISSIKSELKSTGIKIRVLAEKELNGNNALNLESLILKNYTRYNTKLDFSGKTELLDISNDISKIIQEINEYEAV